MCAEQKENRCDFFEWFKEEPEDPLLTGSTDLFSNPPPYKYTVKKTGKMFTSTERDPKKGYAEFLRRGKKHEAPDTDTNLFGRSFIPWEKRKKIEKSVEHF